MKRTLKIMQDECADSPRTWDNVGEMLCWHRNYNLGDENEFSTPERAKAWIDLHVAVCMPLYLYDHSGLTMSTKPFECRWDSGQVGWIWVSKEKARKELGVKRITAKVRERLQDILRSEVDTYDQYLRCEVYGYVLEEDGEEVDSCWGFYGRNPLTNGMVEHIGAEALGACEILYPYE